MKKVRLLDSENKDAYLENVGEIIDCFKYTDLSIDNKIDMDEKHWIRSRLKIDIDTLFIRAHDWTKEYHTYMDLCIGDFENISKEDFKAISKLKGKELWPEWIRNNEVVYTP